VAKKRYFLQPAGTHAKLGIEFMVAKLLQDNTKVLLMLFFIQGALVSPNDITKYSYNPYLKEKAVLGHLPNGS
jgi:hypothetical protein